MGGRGFWITWGANSVRGALGYVIAAREIADQLRALGEAPPEAVFLALGTGGTLAGLAPGCTLHLPDTEVVGYAVSPQGAQVAGGLPAIAEQITRATDYLGKGDASRIQPRYRVEYSQVGDGYGRPTAGSTEAIRLLAQTEAIFVDPVYTAKAFAGLLAEWRAGRFDARASVLFLHTGGVPELLA
jgi:1-aminocyclopropane-1-carboxylate deaminase/D-cysteine desulfhydrase-like pyridoxal-dependent ACC family enzyme